ncbi:ATP-binding protein [Parasphingorhabdus sp.]|uniref:ATP-binding protein n=1 Tax=Parasphingorhabdus sp. TaxID=2709688 RepID=UPI00326726CE
MLSRKTHSSSKSHHHHHHHHSHGMDGQARDREHEMIKNRIVLIVLAFSACAILGAPAGMIIGFGVYFVVSIAIAVAYHVDRAPSDLRRFLGLCTDFGAAAFLFQIGGESSAAVYPLLLWVILGNGFRFGVPWLFLASAMASLAFGWTIYSVDFWRENSSLSIGLLVGLIAIPAYCSTLITKISQAKEEAEAANKSKSLFLASISHELRTPLNAIIGYGTYMLDMKLPEKQHQMVSTSVSAGRHLLHLINQLLSFAHSDSTEELPEPKPFSVVAVLSEVRDIMQIAADEKGLEIVLQADPSSDQIISGQLDYVRNILINLTSNAVKFTESGSITLRCGFGSENDHSQMWVSVSDTGPGIAIEAQKKIFDVFQQADETIASEFGGTGLGLAICQNLAAQMGGDISVESELGAGSTFTVSFPTETQDIEELDADEDSADDSIVRILSLTRDRHAPIICNDDDQPIQIDHIQCHELDDVEKILDQRNLESYDIALLDNAIANDHDDESPLWSAFREAKLPPVLFAEGKEKNLKDIQLRAAFATLLPAGSDFGTIRSAVQIGCSFVTGAQQHADPRNDIEPQPSTTASARVLIADDNRTNQMVLETILANAGHEVTAVADGEKALEELEQTSFDIVFLDVNMPIMGGIECCKLWRQIEGPRQHIPIIGLTADSTDETEKKCLDAGMDLRLTKPIEAKELINVITAQTAGNISSTALEIVPDPLGVISNLHSESSEPATPAVDPAQLEYLLSIGDDAFVQSIIESYLEDTNEILTAFKKSIVDESVEDFRFHAHAFKSGAANIGATGLVETCSILEVITERDFEDMRSEYLAKVEQQIADVRAYLATVSTSNHDDMPVEKVAQI